VLPQALSTAPSLEIAKPRNLSCTNPSRQGVHGFVSVFSMQAVLAQAYSRASPITIEQQQQQQLTIYGFDMHQPNSISSHKRAQTTATMPDQALAKVPLRAAIVFQLKGNGAVQASYTDSDVTEPHQDVGSCVHCFIASSIHSCWQQCSHQ